MAFVQCKDKKEQEEYAEKHKPCFMTEDFRVHTSIRFSDDASYIDIDAKTMMELTDLHNTLEWASSDGLETSFTDLVTVAQDLKKTFLKTMKAIKFHPAKRTKK